MDDDNCPTSPRQHGSSCRPPRNFVSAPCDEIDAAEDDDDDIDDDMGDEEVGVVRLGDPHLLRLVVLLLLLLLLVVLHGQLFQSLLEQRKLNSLSHTCLC